MNVYDKEAYHTHRFTSLGLGSEFLKSVSARFFPSGLPGHHLIDGLHIILLPRQRLLKDRAHLDHNVPGLVMTNSLLLKMAIEIVDFPSYKMVIFHSYVSLSEGQPYAYTQIYTVEVGFWCFWKLPWKAGLLPMQQAVLKTRLDPKRSWTYLELTGSVFWTVFPNPVSHFQSMDWFAGKSAGNQCCYHQRGFGIFPPNFGIQGSCSTCHRCRSSHPSLPPSICHTRHSSHREYDPNSLRENDSVWR